MPEHSIIQIIKYYTAAGENRSQIAQEWTTFMSTGQRGENAK